ncbi:ATP-binding protein [Cylindrospermopsis raciborskii CHAB3438]|jgi:hypothetical protein|uniref:ATP-binding protein n=1 Tax=Cylindrospermopsis raciborskii TaxID=77022 RepID=UPI000E1F4636|nr:ATP-binding protein [Cylindrospermopsis raciborskii]MCH4903339.1 ATP-binding protein [Cylindrospermopsis raciborskii CHAB3438]MEB3144514.1 ATP-binding protein [Cylindrospermopsis raciborskii]UJL34813.1 ATP-binding protein [Cylindrospermopsis raciborskii Cr2010]UJS04329.1 ATP-binding protein [Cylindrospermopsis raciborskii KLL07]
MFLMSTATEEKSVNFDLSTPLQLIGRSHEFELITNILLHDRDLLITGVPGSGRRTLVKIAAQEVGALILEIDCIRAIDGERLLQLFTETINHNWEVSKIETWVEQNGGELFIFNTETRLKLSHGLNDKKLWQAFVMLLDLLQNIANDLNRRVVLILQSFPHIRSWDRHNVWESTLRQEINSHPDVSYVILATIAETSHHQDEEKYAMEKIELAPLERDVMAVWAREVLEKQNLKFDRHSQALTIFLDAVQGSIGDAMALIHRLSSLQHEQGLIKEEKVRQVIEAMLRDLSITYESLLMLLPGNQIHLLECLAIDPTDKPQSKEYIQKHGLSRGGTLQGSLTGLQTKGLIYSAQQGYKLALPLLALWLKQRLN